MSHPAIRVCDLAKQFRLGQDDFQKGLRHTIADALTFWRRSRAPRRAPQETVWALDGVSFEVQPGEVIGIIGRNGAGKSTLLKILSRITEPTRGYAEIRGRVGSLLEVGTGFHPDLTGRENIYLNAAILGMKKAEIDRKFDSIVEFAEIAKFIDTPVKFYSSGMGMRLAFAVAAHLEPEILIIDEVLAVGDAAFQRKCLGKMGEVAHAGRTVLFVSHNMTAVATLCTRVVHLERGRVVAAGEPGRIISDYMLTGATGFDRASFTKDPDFELLDIRVTQPGHEGGAFWTSKPTDITIDYRIPRPVTSLRVGIDVLTTDGITVFQSLDDDLERFENDYRTPGDYRACCRIPANLLAAKSYIISLVVGIKLTRWVTNGAVQQTVEYYNHQGVGSGQADDDWRPGVILPALNWRTEPLSETRPVPVERTA